MDNPALITAWAAVGMAAAGFLGQALATILTGRYNLKLRKFELTCQRYNASIAGFSSAYGCLHANASLDEIAAFLAAAYNVLSVISDPSVTADILQIISIVSKTDDTTEESDILFSQVMCKLSSTSL